MKNTLDTYEIIAATSEKMVEAARQHDWDRLTELEQGCALLVDSLRRNEPDPPLDEADRKRRIELIQRVLDDDATIRTFVEPWMQHVQQFLGGIQRSRAVRQAYMNQP